MKKLLWPTLVVAFMVAGCSDTGGVDDGGSPDDGQEEILSGDDGGQPDNDGVFDAADSASINDAAFVSQNVPVSVAAGTTFSAEITMRNTGTTTWTTGAPGVYRLGAENPRDNTTWGAARAPMAPGTLVAPGETYTFQRNATAPAAAGIYDFQWRMVQEGVEWFGQPSDNLQIEVTGTCVPLTCAQADVICGTVPDGCGGEITCGPCCGQCIEVVNDPLDNSTLGTRTGGQWINGGGWQTDDLDNRIVYAFNAIHCGYLEVDVRNYDPTGQYVHKTTPYDCDDLDTDCYVHVVSLYRADHGDHHAAAANCESQIAVQATGPETNSQNRTKKFKLKAATTGWSGGGNKYSDEYTWDTGHTYHLKLEWNSDEVVFYVDGQPNGLQSLLWPGDPGYDPGESPECEDNHGRRLDLTRFFLGRDMGCQGYLDGPIYSNLVIYDCNP
jgi:hypothetical protein